MEKKVTFGTGKIGLASGVFLIFLFLKLAELGQVATWSWWWVTGPLWMPISIALGFMFIVYFLKFIIFLFELRQDSKRSKEFKQRNRRLFNPDDETKFKKSRFQEKLDALQKPKPWR